MTAFFTAVHILICLILIAVILLQPGRGQGLTGSSFGSGNVQSLLGTRAADFLTKATTVTAICFLLTSIGLDLMEAHKSRSLLEGARTSATADVETLQRALAKLKSEGEKKGTAATQELDEASTKTDTFTDKIDAPAEQAADGSQPS